MMVYLWEGSLNKGVNNEEDKTTTRFFFFICPHLADPGRHDYFFVTNLQDISTKTYNRRNKNICLTWPIPANLDQKSCFLKMYKGLLSVR